MMVIYWIFLIFIILFLIIYILANCNLILKNSTFGNCLRSSKFRYITNRIILSFFILFVISTLVFFIIKALPNIDDNLYYDYSLINYYKRIIPYPKNVCVKSNLIEGNVICSEYKKKLIDFGYSYVYIKNIRVWDIIKEKCSISFSIGIIIYFLECLINYPLGVYLARKSRSPLNKLTAFLYVIITSVPLSLVYYLFLLSFMLIFKLPVSFDSSSPVTYIAPIVSVVLTSLSLMPHWIKMYIQTEMNKDYVKFAYSKGLNEKYIFKKHIMKNALIPLIRTIPTSLVLCITGNFILEATFNIPGSGATLISAIKLNDIYLIEGLILFFSFLSIFAYLISDMISSILDPRIKYMEEHQNER